MVEITLACLFGGELIAMDADVLRGPRVIAKGEKILRPVVPSAAIEAEYRRRLTQLVNGMGKSVVYWIMAAYKGNPPAMATDELSSAALRAAIRELTRRWNRNFDKAAVELAKYFALSVAKRNDVALKKILKDGGWSVEFKLSKAQRDVFNAIVQENVGLIKSIPRQYLGQVEGMTMRSIAAGRDLKGLADDLQRQFGVTKRRAQLIARDQNNKATGAFNTVRQIEIGGVEAEAIWIHSGNTQNARHSHLKASEARTRFKVKDGWYDPEVGRHINPGELINCRCFSRLVMPGFS